MLLCKAPVAAEYPSPKKGLGFRVNLSNYSRMIKPPQKVKGHLLSL